VFCVNFARVCVKQFAFNGLRIFIANQGGKLERKNEGDSQIDPLERNWN